MSTSLSNDMIDLVREFLNHDVEFILVGGHAVNFYSDPRATKDLDLWINPSSNNAKNVLAALKAFGAPVGSAKTSDFCDGKSFFIIGVKPNRVDILQDIPGVNFKDAWSRREKVSLMGLEIAVLSLDDLIKAKVSAGRPQDLADADKLKRIPKK